VTIAATFFSEIDAKKQLFEIILSQASQLVLNILNNFIFLNCFLHIERILRQNEYWHHMYTCITLMFEFGLHKD
jgi:hypothetical protein